MSSLRLVASRPHAGEHPIPKAPGDRRSRPDRRTYERRCYLYPFESRDARLRFAAQAAGFGTYDLDCATGDSVWSPELRAMAGLPPDDAPLTTEQAESLIHPEDRQRFLDKFWTSLNPRGSGEFDDDHRLLRPDGTVCWVRTKGRTFFVGEGLERHSIAASGVVMDITAQRAAEQAFIDSRDELAKLLDSALDAVITVDGDQRIIGFNASAARLFRCPKDEAIGSPLERFIPERYRAVHRKHVAAFADGGATARTMGMPGVFSGRREDGEEFPIEASITKVEMDGRRRMTVFLRDITDRVRGEEALLGRNEQLESSIADRTEELMRANEALERSNLELQQFAFIAAHDLQTPLRSISGFAQLLKKDFQGQLSPAADTWIDQLVRSAQRMKDVIQDILTYSRVESRGQAFLPVDFNQLFDDVVATLDAPIRETDAVVLRGDLPTLEGDRTQLAQILQNLIENALKYRGQDPPQIYVSAGRQNGDWVFSVRDNGIGIPDKHLDQIFDIFRRLHTPQEFPGTGIGLAICRRVVHRHGGRIWAESRLGKGSIFYFSLPEKH